MVKLTLKQCRYFSAVAEQGGVAQAARVLNISQPAISQALEKLEATYDFKLFTRHHAKGMELTPQGRDFLKLSNNLMQNAVELEEKTELIASSIAGTIKFGCFHTIAPFYMPRLIKGYSRRFPQINILSSEMNQEALIEDILNGDLDLALSYDMDLNRNLLEWRVLQQLKPFVILPVEHRLAKQKSVSLFELKDDPYIMFEGFSSKSYFERILSEAGVVPKITHSASSMESVRCCVANGLGYSISVMRPSVQQTYDGNEVIARPIQEDLPLLDIVIVWRKDNSMQKIISDFRQYMIDEVSA